MTFAISGLPPAAFARLSFEVAHDDVAQLLDSYAGEGVIFTIDPRPALREACGFLDGIAGRVGAVDTIVFQPMGASRMTVGFAALPGALGRAMDQVFGVHSGQSGSSMAVIVGSGAEASCAIAAVVQHGYRQICIASAVPGPAMSAAHRMGVDVESVRPDSLGDLDIGVLVNTVDEHVAARPAAVVDLSSTWGDFDGPMVDRQLVMALQVQSQLRAVTGSSPSIEEIRSALAVD
ncbi:hypothetical protein [Trueperella pecoris]|uniref:hypothetical protein n=1 Tax=Trueperella pecoris TaxID=2733571 RepID=UPI00186B613C|nr:hypothetical protein [Trueperella pecoris]QOQ38861.1 hypothetical protein HLG82_04985 [Trueperella pecoris]